jgi:predicted metalloprotease
MRWERRGRSSNLEDRRGSGGIRRAGGLGIGGVVVVLLIALVTKQNPLSLLGALDQGGPVADTSAPLNDPAEEEQVQFVSFVLDDAQAMWAALLPRMGHQYRNARLVLFREQVSSACGVAGSATGPFYCPGDEQVYIDLGFYDELAQRFGAPGDFAEAYVLAHEVGHHVQHVLGTNRAVAEASQRRPDQANALSVLLELQADCYAGIWAARAAADRRLEPGDLEEGLGAAAAVGDDRLQRASTGTVRPESFTHGTSEQRMTWFRRGFDRGDPAYCDTFASR